MPRALFEIWEETDPILLRSSSHWRAQLVNSVACFPTKDAAERYVAAVKDYRKKNGLDEVKKKKGNYTFHKLGD